MPSVIANVGTSIVVLFFAVIMYTVYFGIHRINEGYVGIYYRGGKLLNSITGPGYNVRNPYLTSYDQVQITI